MEGKGNPLRSLIHPPASNTLGKPSGPDEDFHDPICALYAPLDGKMRMDGPIPCRPASYGKPIQSTWPNRIDKTPFLGQS